MAPDDRAERRLRRVEGQDLAAYRLYGQGLAEPGGAEAAPDARTEHGMRRRVLTLRGPDAVDAITGPQQPKCRDAALDARAETAGGLSIGPRQERAVDVP